MNYLVCDCELLKDRIYLLGYVIYDESFNELEKKAIVNKDVQLLKKNGDIRQRSSNKIEKLKENAVFVENISKLIEMFDPVLFDKENTSICYSESDIYAYKNERIRLNLSLFDLYYIDVEVIAKAFLPAKSYSLQNICEEYGILHEDPHNPICDCKATLGLLQYVVKNCKISLNELHNNLSFFNSVKVKHYYQPKKFNVQRIITNEFINLGLIETFNPAYPLENQSVCFNEYFMSKHKEHLSNLDKIIESYGGSITNKEEECTVFIRRETDETGKIKKIKDLKEEGEKIIVLRLKPFLDFLKISKKRFYKKLRN
ncbi:MAG: hypothetical protein ACOCP4_04950 [Candidatus Woesearchaeota archaeon]